MIITRTSMFSGKTRSIDLPITIEQVEKYEAGALIQDAFPNLTDDQREFMLSGAWEGEFDEAFPPGGSDEVDFDVEDDGDDGYEGDPWGYPEDGGLEDREIDD